MSIKTSSLVGLLAIAATPLAGIAGDLGPRSAFDACIKAFSTTEIANHPVRDTRTNVSYGSSTLDYWKPERYTIEVRARGIRSGEVIATARCVVDRDGVVLIRDSAKAEVTTKDL